MAAELPRIVTQLPGPGASAIIAGDAAVLSPSYTRPYPLLWPGAMGPWWRTSTVTDSSTATPASRLLRRDTLIRMW